MTIRITAILVASLLISCTPTPSTESVSGPGQDSRVDVSITLTTEGLIYNGLPLSLGAPISQWTDVLGAARDSKISGELVWDELGIRVYPKSFQDDRVNYAAIILRRNPIYQPPPGVGLEPLKLYKGMLFLEDSAIEKSTTIRDLRGQGYKRNLRINCTKGTGNCFVSHEPRRKGNPNYIALRADTRLDSSPIYRASVGQKLDGNPQAPDQSLAPSTN